MVGGTIVGGGIVGERCCGRKCYITPAFSGIPKQRGSKSELVNPCLLGGHKWAEMLHNPCILGGPQQKGQHQSPPKNKKKQKNFPTLSLTLPTLPGVLQIAPTRD